jgi:hypothetical protein
VRQWTTGQRVGVGWRSIRSAASRKLTNRCIAAKSGSASSLPWGVER